MEKLITIVDYGMGNLRSVAKAIEFSGSSARVSDRPEDVLAARKIVVPGVGHFGDAMRNLRERGLDGAIRAFIERGGMYLGLCVGYQILFESSEEDPDVEGLGVMKGHCRHFRTLTEGTSLKVPHMGWNTVEFSDSAGHSPLLRGIEDNSFFYFVHSYYVDPDDESIVTGWTMYGGRFAAMIAAQNVFGLQFHPEKSQELGLLVIKNFEEL